MFWIQFSRTGAEAKPGDNPTRPLVYVFNTLNTHWDLPHPEGAPKPKKASPLFSREPGKLQPAPFYRPRVPVRKNIATISATTDTAARPS